MKKQMDDIELVLIFKKNYNPVRFPSPPYWPSR